MKQNGNKQSIANRAAVIVDCASYYRAVYEAIQAAQQSVFIIGWDIDSRIELLRGDDKPKPRQSYSLLNVIKRKAESNPHMKFYLLKWESSLIYVNERERLPALTWRLGTPENVDFCIDRTAPYGASQHQKIIVIDDQIAFSGGMDIALSRWDTPEHLAGNELRHDPPPIGSYRPYHDIQMLVDGEAAQHLAEIARWRWQRASGFEAVPMNILVEDIWPKSVRVDFYDIPVQIVLTLPKTPDNPACREVETTFLNDIGKAEEFVFIENQFLTHLPIAKALNQRLHEKPHLRVLMFSSYDPQGPLERETMWQGRIKFRAALEKGIGPGRVGLFYPATSDEDKNVEKDIRVHAKLMIIDDRILRVGAANLNGRSMGTDSECDLICRARNEKHRKAITLLRNRLIASHAGKTVEDVARQVKQSSMETLATPDDDSHRRLRPIDDTKFMDKVTGGSLRRFGDYDTPPLPADIDYKMQTSEIAPPWKRYAFRMIGLVFLLLIAGASYYLSQNGSAFSDNIRHLLVSFRQDSGVLSANASIVTVGIFSILAILSFPITILIMLTSSLYGPWTGFLYVFFGSLFSAAAGFWIGHIAGRQFLRGMLGPRLRKINSMLERSGIISIVLFRMVPIAPFGLTNLAIGVSSVSFINYMVGTTLGMLPGMVALTILGDSLGTIILDMKLNNIVYLVVGLSLWIGIIALTQILTSHWQKRKKKTRKDGYE